jgi:hypothetical protein
MGRMNTLIIGGEAGIELYKMAYQDDDYTHIGFKALPRNKDYFDQVICFHTLQLQGVREGVDYLKNIAKTMKVGATINLFVPSLEWAAEQIIYQESPSPLTLVQLYGGQQGANQWHKSGYTMRGLRRDFDLAGFSVTHASVGTYELLVASTDGRPVPLQADQHIIVAYKRSEKENEPFKKITE